MEQGTAEWKEVRIGKITASRIKDVMAKETTAAFHNYLTELVMGRLAGVEKDTPTTFAMQHGIEAEPQARARYTLETGRKVVEVGFIPHQDIDHSGASPDGLVGDDGLVEIKCPQALQHMKTIAFGEIKPEYMLQMQWQMECTKRQWCDFVSFNSDYPEEHQLQIIRVQRDDELIDKIKDRVQAMNAEIAKTITNVKMKEAA